MARGLVTLKSTGLSDWIKELEGVADAFPEVSKEALKAQQEVIVDRIRQNWVSLVGGQSCGFVYSSIGQSTAYSKSDRSTIVGTVGVYKIDAIASQFGKTDKDLNAAQIAYWVNFGTSRLRSGVRKKKDVTYDDSQLITTNPIPFIDNAFYSTLDAGQEAFKIKFNQLMEQISYSGA